MVKWCAIKAVNRFYDVCQMNLVFVLSSKKISLNGVIMASWGNYGQTREISV